MRTVARIALVAVTLGTVASTVAATDHSLPSVELVESRGVSLGSGLLTHSASTVEGTLWTTSGTAVTAYDLDDPADPTWRWQLSHPVTPLPSEEVQGAAGRVAALVPMRDDAAPVVSDSVHTSAGSFCARGCRLVVIDTGRAEPRVLGDTAEVSAHTVACIADCTHVWASSGQVFEISDDGVVLQPERWTESMDTFAVHHVREIAPQRAVVVGNRSVVLADTTDPKAPEAIRTWPLEDRAGAANHVETAPGTTEVFVGEYATPPTADCGLTWLDTAVEGLVRRWVPDVEASRASAHPNSCVTDAAPHPGFARNRLVAVGVGRGGVVIAHVSARGRFTELLVIDGRELGVRGQVVDLAWTSPTSLAVADYDGGLHLIELRILGHGA